MPGPIAPCLWFPGNAVEAVDFYVSIFRNARVLHVDRYSDVGPDPEAPVVFMEFELNGQPFQAINAADVFPFTEAISLAVDCGDQEEVDYYWNALLEGGSAMACGWLKDKYGVSWQIVPRRLNELLRADDRVRAGQVMRKMLEQQKIDIAELEAAWAE